jgi:hypothetical protein
MADSQNIEKALAYLGTSISTLIEASKAPVDLSSVSKFIPKKGLTGDQISGGVITAFASQGIKDEATVQQITVKDSAVHIKKLTTDQVGGNLNVENIISAKEINISNNITAKTIKADIIEVKEIRAESKSEKTTSLNFTATKDDPIDGKGLLWSGNGYTKQLVFKTNPDRLLCTENIALPKDRNINIDNVVVLSSSELGTSVVKSNLKQLGRLQGLIVDGNVSIGQYVYYNNSTNRFGIGIENPHAGFSVSEDGIEVMLGTNRDHHGIVGTHISAPFDIVTDNTSRIAISSKGNILLGNRAEAPIEVAIHGKLAVGVKTMDERVDLHVAGAIKFQDKVQQYSNSSPTSGTCNRGDIVWNSEPEVGKTIGWVCVRAGSPGSWAPFGDIKPIG